MIGAVFWATILFFSTAVASGISAGKDVNVTAVEKDINIKGSEVTGENVTLTAKGDINITAAANTNKVESNEEKSSGGFGVSVGTTGTFSVYAKSQKSNTDTDQNISGWTQSNVTAKDTLTLTSGADANIIGSKVKGEKVNANIGGDMNIASLQDTDNYKSNSSSYGFSITSDIGGATNFSVNGNKNKMNSEYASVTDQAGIYAGNRGFDIVVAKNTDLKGAVIDSTATGDKNTLITGTITFDDIKNTAEYDSSGYGFSYSGERNKDKAEQNILKQGDKGFIPNIPMGSSDEDSSTTKSAIADGTIVLTKPSEQKQDVTQLNRNTQDTLNKLDKIFDKKEIEEKQELAGLFAELSFNAIHDLSATKKDKDGNVIKQGWSEEQKVLAHAAVGYISAELAGSKSSFSTALAAGVNKFVTEEILKDDKKRLYYAKHPEELQWLSAALGATIGQMAGDAGSGASIAASGTKNNALNDKDALAYIIAKEKGDEETVISLEDKSQRQSEEFQKRYKEDADFAQRYNDAKKANSDLKEFEGYVVWGSSPEKGDGIYTSQEVVEHSHLYFPSDYSVDEKRVFMTPSADKVAGVIMKNAAITVGGVALSGTTVGAGLVFLYNVYDLNKNHYNYTHNNDVKAGQHVVVDAAGMTANSVSTNPNIKIALTQLFLNTIIDLNGSGGKKNVKQ